jgi:hypothetical protein
MRLLITQDIDRGKNIIPLGDRVCGDRNELERNLLAVL